jgi:putative Mg2+ transporter-C (MgtC) family protein
VPAWLGQSVWELALLSLAFVLSAVIGFERQRQLKSAGLRTHTLVGLGSAVFTLVSAYGFTVFGLAPDAVIDPSRIAAQIVSGIGFLGAGVIFVRQNVVNGLTTAASIWVTASVGMACGAGMPLLALAATGFYLLAMSVLARLGRRIRAVDGGCRFVVQYKDRRGVLRQILACASERGFQSSLRESRRVRRGEKTSRVEVDLRFVKPSGGSFDELLEALSDIKGVVSVRSPHGEAY